LINGEGLPEIPKNDQRGQIVFAYMEKIPKKTGLEARYAWRGVTK
jgi:hypothetical protein